MSSMWQYQEFNSSVSDSKIHKFPITIQTLATHQLQKSSWSHTGNILNATELFTLKWLQHKVILSKERKGSMYTIARAGEVFGKAIFYMSIITYFRTINMVRIKLMGYLKDLNCIQT
jgi:hypothetical protein